MDKISRRPQSNGFRHSMTIAEMKPFLSCLLPNETLQALTAKKMINEGSPLLQGGCTAGGSMKHTYVRRAFNLEQPIQRSSNTKSNSRTTIKSKIPKPGFIVKKLSRTNERINGTWQIVPETPVNTKPAKAWKIVGNKNNVAKASLNTNAKHQFTKTNINKKLTATPKPILRKNLFPNISHHKHESISCDACSLQNVGQDNAFDQLSNSKQNGRREDNVIVSSWESSNETTSSNTVSTMELGVLLQLERNIVNNVQILDNKMNILEKKKQNIEITKETELKSLQNIRILINEKQVKEKRDLYNEKFKDLKRQSPKQQVTKSFRIIGSKTPRSKTCLQKKAVCKSISKVSHQRQQKNMDNGALNMQMKRHINLVP